VIAEALIAGGIAGFAALAVLAANRLRDRGTAASLSRRVAAVLGGGACLIAVLTLDAWMATAISASVALSVLLLRVYWPQQVRGLSGSGPVRRWGEIAYLLAATMAIMVGWGVLGDKWLAFLPIAFMAWGDNAAGLVRALGSGGREVDTWASAAMLAVCLGAAALYQPYWIGAIGAVAATVAERFRPASHPLWDDNWIIVAASLFAMRMLTTSNL